ncbi:hypothetical protein GPB2148_1181 [marine gamma proteobacterium HTCC2148]|nr:hypothetical protein GPB2148_1181 [marine gamma proteobacterium HTCC2148]
MMGPLPAHLTRAFLDQELIILPARTATTSKRLHSKRAKTLWSIFTGQLPPIRPKSRREPKDRSDKLQTAASKEYFIRFDVEFTTASMSVS